MRAGGIELRLRTIAGDLTARCRVIIGERQIIRARGIARNRRAFARHYRRRVSGTRDCRRVMGFFFDANVRGTGSCSAFAVVDFGGNGVGPGIHTGWIPPCVGAVAFHASTGSGVAIGEREII